MTDNDDDDTVPFLVLATRQGSSPFTTQFFVRAKSLADAYTQVLLNDQGLRQHPDVRLQGFVASTGSMAQVLNLKRLAKFYWDAGRVAQSNPNYESFEDTWDEHGAEPDDD